MPAFTGPAFTATSAPPRPHRPHHHLECAGSGKDRRRRHHRDLKSDPPICATLDRGRSWERCKRRTISTRRRQQISGDRRHGVDGALWRRPVPARVRAPVNRGRTQGRWITSSLQGSYPDDDDALPFFQLATELDVPVVIHPPSVGFGEERTQGVPAASSVGRPMDGALAIARLIVRGVFEKFPTLKLVGTHLGGGICEMNRPGWTTPIVSRTRPISSGPTSRC